MKKVMHTVAWITLALTVMSIWLCIAYQSELAEVLAITFGTTAYHFWMRLFVGWCFDVFMHNKANYHKKWYQQKPWEGKFYDMLRVRKWKGDIPSYDPECFNPKKHTWDEIAQAMCQAELVHEVIIVLSFAPVICAYWFSVLPVFLMTSVLAALFDSMFVMLQRYNRPRVVRLAERQKTKLS